MKRRLQRWRSELNNMRLTLLVTLLFTVLVASIFPTPPIRFMVALLCAGPMISLLIAQLLGRSIHASRTVPDGGTVGDLINGQIQVRNNAPYPILFARIEAGECVVPASRTPVIEALEGAERIFAILRPYERVTVPFLWKLNRRGVWQLPPVQAGSTDPLGLSSSLTSRTPANTITVLPKPVHVTRLGFLSGSRNGAHAISYAAAVTEATDFHGIRAWRPGEGVRRVHWKSTARTGHLHVVEWEEDLSADLVILLDVQTAPGLPAGSVNETLESGVTLAASVASYLLETGYTVELFYWQSPLGETSMAQDRKTEAKPQLRYHRASGVRALGPLLRALTDAEPLSAGSASLSLLASEAVPHISSDHSVLFLTEMGAETAATIIRSAGVPAEQCTIFHLEGEPSSERPAHGNTGTEERTSANAGLRPGGVRTHFIRRGDSLAAALERA